MLSYWTVNSAGEILSKQYANEKAYITLGSSIVDGLGNDNESNDFELVPDGTWIEATVLGAKYKFVSCHSSTPFCPKRHLFDLLEDPVVSEGGLRIGIEFEFYVLPGGDVFSSSLEPGAHAYQLSSFVVHHELQTKIHDLLVSLGIEQFCLHPEGSAHQFEVSFGPLHPYELAVKYSIFRSLLPGLAASLGYRVFSSPRPFEGQFINALHVNLSWENYSEAQQFKCAERIATRSPLLQFIYNPSEESYLALKDPVISDVRPSLIAWITREERNGIIRHISRDGRFEFRLPDTSTNIFSVISAIIWSYTKLLEVSETNSTQNISHLMSETLEHSRSKFEDLAYSVPKPLRNEIFGLGGLLSDQKILKELSFD